MSTITRPYVAAPQTPAPSPAPPGEPPRALDTHWQTRTAAALILGLAAIGIWQPQLGGGVLWAVPVLGFAILIMVRAIVGETPLQVHVINFSWALWIPLAVLLAGAPVSAIGPHQLVVGLVTIFRGAAGPLGLASWLAFTGSCWIIGATQAVRPGRGPAAAGFVLLTLPFAFALAVPRTGDAAWYGGALLAAALLWATRGTLRGGLPAALSVAVIGTIVAAAIGPTERRIPQREAPAPSGGAGGIDQVNGANGGRQSEKKEAGPPQPLERELLDPTMSYGPASENGDGNPQVSFEVRSRRPALWRMQVYESWDGRGWSVADTAGRELRQPAATRMRMQVQMGALSDRHVFSAGRVASVPGKPVTDAPGEGKVFAQPPKVGERYDVLTDLVSADIPSLNQIALPSPAKYPSETLIWPSLPATQSLPQRIAQMPRDVSESGWGDVYRLAWQLSRGETTEMGVVRNVLGHLRNPANFSYTLGVKAPGAQPLVSFLLDTHVGYCQHFAGAAALLLRLAGVPARVAAGYATGVPDGDDRYVVHSSDAHAWIEVYFEGYGWVPFNPTPPDAAAEVAPTVDPTAPPKVRHGVARFDLRQLAVLILGGLALWLTVRAIKRWRRRDSARLPMSELLLRVVPGPTGPQTTLRSIAPDLAKLGPSTAALGEAAEQGRFVPGGYPNERRPRWLLWRTLRRDVGALRASWLMLFGAPRPEDDAGSVVGVDATQALRDTASVAPPPGARS